jgi:hypothetical protein
VLALQVKHSFGFPATWQFGSPFLTQTELESGRYPVLHEAQVPSSLAIWQLASDLDLQRPNVLGMKSGLQTWQIDALEAVRQLGSAF